MHRFKRLALIVAALATVAVTACAPIPSAMPAAPAVTGATTIAKAVAAPPAARVITVSPSSLAPTTSAATTIKLGDPIAVEGAGATVSGSIVTITTGGIYRLTGTLSDGQVVVAAKSSETVQLIMDGAGITSSTSAPLYVKSAKSATILLADGSQSYLADGASRPAAASGSDEPNAALYSEVDLTVGGNGSLIVDARYNDGIASKDDLHITSGAIDVVAPADGIRGRDSLTVDGGTMVVTAGKDGLKSGNDEDPEKGVVAVNGGTIQITAREDGIQAETNVAIAGGTLTITSGGGSTASPSTDVSAKGIKGQVAVTIDGGTITIDAADDALHSDGSLAVRGGTLLLATAGDGIHADTTLDIAGGDVTISGSYEGIESARIAISDGRIRIKSRDDGLNVASGNDGAASTGSPGQAKPAASSNYRLTISGGYIVIDSDTDGIDANGSIDMTGGVAIVHGPTAQRDGALDYDGAFTITGGTLIAAGSAGMAQAPGATSTQSSVLLAFPSSLPAGTIVNIGTSSGQELLTFAPGKAFQTLVVSSPKLETGDGYVVYTGGTSTGAAADGLYSGGAYTAGDQAASFTVNGAVTKAGSGNVGPMRGGGPRR